MVALLAEGVDRNLNKEVVVDIHHGSPSSRRAWIEILVRRIFFQPASVALLAEGVDRNFITSWNTSGIYGSPSSRRA